MAPSRRIVLLTADRVGPAMAGPAIRATELARVLAGDGHRVVLASPWVDDDGDGDDGVRRVAAWGDNLRPVVADADVVVAMTSVLYDHAWLADMRAVAGNGGRLHVVADAYDPVLFEVLAGFAHTAEPERSARAADAAARMCAPLAWADAVLCATESQRHLLLGVLASQGRLGPVAWDADATLAAAVATVAFGLPTEPPVRSGPGPLRGPDGPFGAGDTVLLWGGGLWDWLDPLTLVEAVARCGDPSVRAFFLAGSHPTPTVGAPNLATATRDRAAELGLVGSGAVAFADDWVAYDQRAGYLTDATAGVTLAPGHAETTFAYRTRVLDYLWASLPVVCSAGDDLADLVDRRALGVVVPPGDVGAVVAAIGMLGDSGWYASCRSRVADVAASLTWPTVAGPLRDFCREPRSVLSDPLPPTPSAPWTARRVAAAVRNRVTGR
jgi:glycosyltransferase involved in cell wall biosynthesis